MWTIQMMDLALVDAHELCLDVLERQWVVKVKQLITPDDVHGFYNTALKLGPVIMGLQLCLNGRQLANSEHGELFDDVEQQLLMVVVHKRE